MVASYGARARAGSDDYELVSPTAVLSIPYSVSGDAEGVNAADAIPSAGGEEAHQSSDPIAHKQDDGRDLTKSDGAEGANAFRPSTSFAGTSADSSRTASSVELRELPAPCEAEGGEGDESQEEVLSSGSSESDFY